MANSPPPTASTDQCTRAGEVILVTGGGSGIGRAVAMRLARPNSRLVLLDRDSKSVKDCAEEGRRRGADILAVTADIADPEEIESGFARILDRFGRIDRCINCAGLGGGDRSDWDAELWERLWKVNVRGTMLCMQHSIRAMLDQGGGSIVNIASVAGLVGSGHPAYCASKHAVVGLTRAFAVRYADRGIHINAVCPGSVDTPMIRNAERDRPGLTNKSITRHPIGRLGTAEEVADAIIWLGGPDSRFIVGQAIAVDGGFTAI